MEKIWTKNYDAGVPSEIDMAEYKSISDILDKTYAKFGTKDSFHNMGKTLTYNELKEMSQKFGSYLQSELGLKKGDRVALMMPNILQYPVALFGILQAGMIAVNVNPLYTARELQHQLKDSGAETIIIFENSAHTLQEVLGNTGIKNVITTGIGDLLG
ncbi:MAG: long-chain acyl-CoA synthetase, partial [Thermoproteota archaeon]